MRMSLDFHLVPQAEHAAVIMIKKKKGGGASQSFMLKKEEVCALVIFCLPQHIRRPPLAPTASLAHSSARPSSAALTTIVWLCFTQTAGE